jgi:hypothetical protein
VPLIRTLVSRTMRSRDIGSENLGESGFREALCGGIGRNLVPEIEEGPYVAAPEPLELRHRDDDRDVPVLPANDPINSAART